MRAKGGGIEDVVVEGEGRCDTLGDGESNFKTRRTK
jgi:hypothetical protein